MPSKLGRYTLEEVTTLVEEYGELSPLRYKQWILVRMVDLDIGFRKLSRPHQEAVLLCGIAGLTTRSAGKLMGISHEAARKRYWRGLREIVKHLNGGNT